MNRLKAALVVLLLVPIGAGAAPPTDLFTPFLNVAGNQLVCNVVNVSTNVVNGSVTLITSAGTPITGTIPFSLPPGEAAVVAGPFGIDGYCKISIAAKADAVRANLCVAEFGQGCVATADAR